MRVLLPLGVALVLGGAAVASLSREPAVGEETEAAPVASPPRLRALPPLHAAPRRDDPVRGLDDYPVFRREPIRSESPARAGPDPFVALRRIACGNAAGDARVAALEALEAAGAGTEQDVAVAAAMLEAPGFERERVRILGLLERARPPATLALPAVARAASSDVPGVRIAALRAAARLVGDDRAVVDLLLTAATGVDPDDAAVAASLLGRFPSQATTIVPRLTPLLEAEGAARGAALASLRALVLAVPETRSSLVGTTARDEETAAEVARLLAPPSVAPQGPP